MGIRAATNAKATAVTAATASRLGLAKVSDLAPFAKDLVFGENPNHTLNYYIRVLGRQGVLELNAGEAARIGLQDGMKMTFGPDIPAH